jgi:hypothetical protein
MNRVDLRTELGLGEKQLEYLRCRGLPDAGVGPHNRRYFRLADVQAWLAEYWREKECLAAEARELAEMPAKTRRRRADGGAKWLTKQAASAQADQEGCRPCYSKAGAAGVARAREWTAEDEADTDVPGQHGGNHNTPMAAGSPTSWDAIVAGTMLEGMSWADACKTVRPVL